MILRALTLWRLWQAYRVVTRPRSFRSIVRANGAAYLAGFETQLDAFREQIAMLVAASRLPGSRLVPELTRPIDTLKNVTLEIAAVQAERDRQALRGRSSWLRHPIKRFRLRRSLRAFLKAGGRLNARQRAIIEDARGA